MTKIDPRLLKLYNEYLSKDKEEEFLDMLYAILENANVEVRKRVYRARAAWKRKITYKERKELRSRIEAHFASMSPEELIEFQNTPWEELPEWIREAMPKLVQHPEKNNYVRIYGLVDPSERQSEISASRLTRYMEKHGFITSDEEGTHLHFDNFAEVCNEKAEKFDLPATRTQKAQKVRITNRDLKNYTECRVTPKGDKMAVLAAATEMPLWYLAGYLNNDVPEIKPGNPLEPAPFTNRYRKPRAKRA